MQIGTIVKVAERALPFITAAGSLAIQFYQARNADRTNGSQPHEAQVGTKSHGRTGLPIGYGKNGRYLRDALGRRPSEH